MEKLTKKEKKELRKQEWQEKAKQEERNALYKKVGIIVGVVLIVGLSVVGLVKLAGTSGTSSSGINVPPVSKSDITQGDAKSKVVLIEYSDFQCPACKAYHPLVKQLLSDFNGKIYFAYRFFPLTSIHKNALISSQAAYAARLQGKFWEMHDMLFDTQTLWAEDNDPTETFVSYAQKLGLNTTQFRKDLNSSETQGVIADSQNQASSIGVNSTPSFFVNGQQITNPQNYNDFKKTIQDEFNKK